MEFNGLAIFGKEYASQASDKRWCDRGIEDACDVVIWVLFGNLTVGRASSVWCSLVWGVFGVI